MKLKAIYFALSVGIGTKMKQQKRSRNLIGKMVDVVDGKVRAVPQRKMPVSKKARKRESENHIGEEARNRGSEKARKPESKEARQRESEKAYWHGWYHKA